MANARRFVGQQTTKLDDRNRVVIPASFRAKFNARPAYLTLGRGACIAVYTDEDYDEKARQVSERYDADDPEGLEERRRFFGETEEAAPDGQGRVTLSATFLNHAGLSRNDPALVVGVGEFFEIWHPDRWARRREQTGG